MRSSTALSFEGLGFQPQSNNWFILLCLLGILAIAIFYQSKKFTKVFIILLGYGLIWSFIFTEYRAAFSAYFCWLLPFGNACHWTLSRNGNPTLQ